MTLKFLVDANLPIHLAIWLQEQGYDAQHVRQLGIIGTHDNSIWQYAKREDYVIVSKDQDFYNRHQRGQNPKLIWVKWGNTSRKALKSRFSKVLENVINSLESGDTLVELTDWPT